MQMVDAEAALDAVVAAFAPDRVVASAADERFAGIRAAEDNVLVTGKPEVIGRAHHQGGRARDGGDDVGLARRVGISEPLVVLLGLVHLDDVVGRLERGSIDMQA
ncbi:hypothetical protein D3C72_2118260 [compost metagenome]